MRSLKIACVGLVPLVLGLLMYCSSVMGKESGGEAKKKSSHPKLVYVKRVAPS